MLNLEIETERLIIRPFRLADVESSYEMNLDPEVNKYTGDGGVVSLEEMRRKIVENVFGDYEKYGYGRLAVELKGVDSFIGFAGLKYLSDLKAVDLGYRFKRKYWGQGIATESGRACIQMGWEQLGLEEMLGFVLPGNIGSVRVLEKLGFQYEKEFLEEGLMVKQYLLKKKTAKPHEL